MPYLANNSDELSGPLRFIRNVPPIKPGCSGLYDPFHRLMHHLNLGVNTLVSKWLSAKWSIGSPLKKS